METQPVAVDMVKASMAVWEVLWSWPVDVMDHPDLGAERFKVRQVLDALISANVFRDVRDVQSAPAVDKRALVSEMQSIGTWWHVAGNDGPVHPDYMVDALVDSGVLRDVRDVQAEALEQAADDIEPLGYGATVTNILRMRAQAIREARS